MWSNRLNTIDLFRHMTSNSICNSVQGYICLPPIENLCYWNAHHKPRDNLRRYVMCRYENPNWNVRLSYIKLQPRLIRLDTETELFRENSGSAVAGGAMSSCVTKDIRCHGLIKEIYSAMPKDWNHLWRLSSEIYQKEMANIISCFLIS